MQYSDNVSINHKARESLPIDKLPGVFGNEDNNIINSSANIILPDLSKAESLVDVLRYRNQHQGSDKAYTFLPKGETEEIVITYQELDKKARAIAAVLQSMDANGQRALLIYQPGLEFIEAFFGCLYAGVIAVPVYPPKRNHHGNRMQAIVSDSQATIALTTTSVFNNIENSLKSEAALANLSYITTDLIDSEKASDWQYPQIDKNTLAFLQYTSGSTGTPKGVMVSHGNLLYNEEMIKQGFSNTSDKVYVVWLPLYHDMGLIGNILQTMYLGVHCVFMPPTAFLQKPIRWLKAISRYKATTSGGPNFAYDVCVQKIKPEQLEGLDLSSWEIAFSGAEPVRAKTIERFSETFAKCGFRKEAFYPCYGMAETTLFVSGGLKSEEPIIRALNGTELSQNRVVFTDKSRVDSQEFVGCGRTWMEQKIAIVNPDTLVECNHGEVGEIWVSGANIAQGYWRKPEQTEKTFNAYIADTVKGPFLRTGDLGFLQDGELFITGRIKDVIIIRGQNHYPQDIELTVENSHVALKPGSGAAFTVEVKNQERLVIVQEVERTYLRKLNINEVVGNISEAVTAKHGLQIYSTVLIKTGSIPKTSSGKIQRHACKNAFLNDSLNVLNDWSENPSQKANFRHLKTDVESLLKEVKTEK